MPAQTSSSPPALENLLSVGGYAAFLLCSLVYFLTSWGLPYKIGLLSICVSYTVAVYRASLAFPPNNNGGVYWYRLLSIESLPSLILTVILYLMAPVGAKVLLLAPAIRAAYEVVSYARSNPALLQTPWWKQWGNHLSEQLMAVQQGALDFAGHLELLALPWLLIAALSGQGSFLLAIFYMQFFRWRYSVNPHTRLIVSLWDQLLNKAISSPSCPLAIRHAYLAFKSHLKRFVSPPNPNTTDDNGRSGRARKM